MTDAGGFFRRLNLRQESWESAYAEGQFPCHFSATRRQRTIPSEDLVLAGCRIDGVMGKGSAATVYKAHHLALDVPVAIKILTS